MSTTRDDGGPAFPQKEPLTSDHPGMSLREWFAGMALQGQLASMSTAAAVAGIRGEDAPDWCAVSAYAFADAMLAARKEAK